MSCFGHLGVPRFCSALQHVLDFLQTLALGVGQHESREQQSEYTAHGKYPKSEVYADDVAHVDERFRQHEAQNPTKACRHTRRYRFEIRREYLSHDSPW